MRSCSCILPSFSVERSASGNCSSPLKHWFRSGSPFAARRVPMNKHFLIRKVTISTSLIVLSIAVPVNLRFAGMARPGTYQVVDGVPLPPPHTKLPTGASIQVADGVPLPPPHTKLPTGASVQVADGLPLPPPITHPPKF